MSAVRRIYPPVIYELIQSFQKLPSIGPRSAEKLAFALLQWPRKQLHSFSQTLERLEEALGKCQLCGCLYDASGPCWSCAQTERHLLCVVCQPREAFTICATTHFKSPFHVLGGLLDPMHGVDIDALQIAPLLQRLAAGQIKEVLLALDATLEGDATAHYIKEQIEKQVHPVQPDVKISRLAFGMPINSPLEFVDPATLSRAIHSKNYW